MNLTGYPPPIGSTFRVLALRGKHGRNERYARVHHVRAHVDGITVTCWWSRSRQGWEYEIVSPEQWHTWATYDGFVTAKSLRPAPSRS